MCVLYAHYCSLMSRYIDTLPQWPLGTALPKDGQFIMLDPTSQEEFRVLPEQVGGGTLYPEAGPNTDGPMSQKAATDYANRGPNYVPGAGKSVIYLTKAAAIADNRPDDATLEGLDSLALCTGTVVRVDLHPAAYGAELILVYDDRPDPSVNGGIRAFLDGNFRRNTSTYDGLQPLKWVRKGSVEEAIAGIRRYAPAYAKWRQDETMKIDFGGTDAFFSAVAAGGPFPAPTAAGVATADWKPTTAPAATGGGGPAVATAILGDVPTPKALAVIAAYSVAGGPIEETDELYFGQEFTDDYTELPDVFWYVCRQRRPLTTGQPTRWFWSRFHEAGA